MSKGKGFTLVEVLIVMAIIGVLAAIAAPAYDSYISKRRLTRAVTLIEAGLKLAGTESVKRQANFYFSIIPGGTWCYGLSTAGACDCTKTTTCLVDGNSVTQSSTSFTNVTTAVSGLSTSGGVSYLTFDKFRGATGTSSSITLSSGSYQAVLNIDSMGLVTCSTGTGGNAVCGP